MANIKPKYYSLLVAEEDKEANIYIYGDIVSWEWLESDVSSYTLAKEIETLPKDIKAINVFINSYGGEVAEGLAIYNALRRCKGKVKTYCDGFACSAASLVFIAGDERIMSNASLLWIHNAQWGEWGDYHALQKKADDAKTVNEACVQVYMNHVTITEEELTEMMDETTWIKPEDAVTMGFATSVVSPAAQDGKAAASASLQLRKQVVEAVLQTKKPAKKPTEKLTANISIEGDSLKEQIEKAVADVMAAAVQGAITEPRQKPADPAPSAATPQPENKLPKLLAALFAKKGEETS